jgi:hypothetical protein
MIPACALVIAGQEASPVAVCRSCNEWQAAKTVKQANRTAGRAFTHTGFISLCKRCQVFFSFFCIQSLSIIFGTLNSGDISEKI